MCKRQHEARDGGFPEGRQHAGTAAVDAQTYVGSYGEHEAGWNRLAKCIFDPAMGVRADASPSPNHPNR
eukprot:8270203-Pyramimonas_sp.AAC.1